MATEIVTAATVEESSEPLKYQTWVLKVSIHCEGCKKKVKKVLQSIDGVYQTTIDSPQHKVTVTGDVDSEKLIKKLIKTGKHAELWPQPIESSPTTTKDKKKNKGKNKNNDNSNSNKSDGDPKPTNDNQEGKSSDNNQQKKSTPTAANKDNKVSDQGKQNPVKVNEGAVKSNGGKENEKKPENQSTQNEKQGNGKGGVSGNGGGGGGGGGKGGKKKGKKGQNANNNSNTSTPGGVATSVDTSGSTKSQSLPVNGPGVSAGPVNLSPPPPQQSYPYGPYTSYGHHQPSYGPPAYVMSYSTSYPTVNYAASYYTPPEAYTYSKYVQSGSTGGFFEASPPLDSYEKIHDDDDQNESGCWIM
ncbi:hypothetical protein MKW94_007252 [Papaver nudicaule]|uniref:HMA domain-containing protein n=1 Tax=Papaver nudicaule TaxID=74823 RepID=A0AA41V4C9_PAPNU|nr:hypothetical protein [Papaver nudicaule]